MRVVLWRERTNAVVEMDQAQAHESVLEEMRFVAAEAGLVESMFAGAGYGARACAWEAFGAMEEQMPGLVNAFGPGRRVNGRRVAMSAAVGAGSANRGHLPSRMPASTCRNAVTPAACAHARPQPARSKCSGAVTAEDADDER